MWKSKKVVLLAAVAVALLIAGVVAGVTLAQSGNGNVTGNETQANTQYQDLLNKVAAIYQQNTGVTIDPQQLETAFTQARNELQSEALQTWLQNLVTQGKITQAQADQLLQWWQSKPDIPSLELPRAGGMFLGRGHGCWGNTVPETPGS